MLFFNTGASSAHLDDQVAVADRGELIGSRAGAAHWRDRIVGSALKDASSAVRASPRRRRRSCAPRSASARGSGRQREGAARQRNASRTCSCARPAAGQPGTSAGPATRPAPDSDSNSWSCFDGAKRGQHAVPSRLDGLAEGLVQQLARLARWSASRPDGETRASTENGLISSARLTRRPPAADCRLERTRAADERRRPARVGSSAA